MTALDRYVARIVFGSFAAGLVFFLFLAIVVDLLGGLARYSEKAAEQQWSGLDLALYLGHHYLLFLPVLFVTITPFVTVIAGMFTLARLQNANEVVPMLFVGRSMQRLLRPMLLCGTLAGLGMVGCWQWVVPGISAELAESDSALNRGSTKQKHLVDELEREDSTYRFYVAEFNPADRTIADVSMLVEGVLAADNVIFTASSGTWDEARGDWRLVDGKRWIDGGKVPQTWLERPDLTPAVLLQRSRENVEADTLSYTELLETMALRPNRAGLRLAFHRHITYPFANLILLLIALPLAVWFERGGRISRVLLAIGLCGLYALFDLVCQSLGQKGHIHPVVAAWAPTIVFGSLGVVLFGGTKS
jgi:lipopolysaccharide export system permease protein